MGATLEITVPYPPSRAYEVLMLAVTSTYPDRDTDLPPIVLVHGAANSALVWTYWQPELADRGWAAHAPDLRGHGRSSSLDLTHTSSPSEKHGWRVLGGMMGPVQ